MTARIAMWSGPRNISTAMMRSFGARGDCAVSDEPLYGHYLTHTKLDHPMKDDVIASQPNDWQTVVQSLQGDVPKEQPVWYQKHMTHHLLPHIDRAWMKEVRHCFLIRDPKEVLASYTRSHAQVSLADLGFEAQAEIFDYVTQTLGQPAVVLDSNDVLKNPAQMLEKLCNALEIPYSNKMLHWEPGLHETDGVWAPHWYHSVMESSGFAPYRERFPEYLEELEPIAQAARDYYELLYQKRMQLN